MSASLVRVRLALLAALAAVAACRTPPPHITFVETPPGAQGGPLRTAMIAGRVERARPGDRLVLFAKSGVWYVQPLRNDPFTAIDAEGRWRSTIHLGSDYAALLVREGYRPPDSTPVLPDLGPQVVAIATVTGGPGRATNAPAFLQFSGYDWEVRQHGSDRGGANEYHPDNARVDASGALHLKLAQRDDQWTSAEVGLTRPLGYGTYVFIVRDLTAVDAAARLALFTFDPDGRAQHFREMNVDLWRDDGRGAMGGQFVLQPNYVAGNLHRFSVPSGRVSHTIRWEPGVLSFKSIRGSFLERPGAVVASQTFTTGVPAPGDERAHMAFYYYRKAGRPPQADTEIVIERFQHLP